MTRKTALWLLVVTAILLILGSGSVILERSAGPGADVPSGFLH